MAKKTSTAAGIDLAKVVAQPVPEGETASAGQPSAADQADAAVSSSDAGTGLPATDALQSESAAGTNSTNNPESSAAGGAGDTASPAGGAAEKPGIVVPKTMEEFYASYPKLAAAVDAWTSDHDSPPKHVRIIAKREGFRRAGMAHSRAGAEHPVESFKLPEDLEALFAEPNLVVTFV